MAVQASEAALQIAFCDDFEVTEIEGDVRTIASDSEWETFLSVSGHANFVHGISFSSLSIPEGLEGRFDDLDPTTIDSLFFSVAAADDSADGAFTFSAHFESDGALPSTEWLQTDGSVTEAPCA